MIGLSDQRTVGSGESPARWSRLVCGLEHGPWRRRIRRESVKSRGSRLTLRWTRGRRGRRRIGGAVMPGCWQLWVFDCDSMRDLRRGWLSSKALAKRELRYQEREDQRVTRVANFKASLLLATTILGLICNFFKKKLFAYYIGPFGVIYAMSKSFWTIF